MYVGFQEKSSDQKTSDKFIGSQAPLHSLQPPHMSDVSRPINEQVVFNKLRNIRSGNSLQYLVALLLPREHW